jgi:predicted nucleic-acid-binding protein
MGSAQNVKSVDTNVLVHFVTRDNEAQADIAQKIIATGVHIPLTVLLELGWVLSSFNAFDRQRLNATYRALLDSTVINVHDEPAIRAALDLHRAGANLAAVFHLVAARGSEAFVTFDQGLKGHPDIGVAVEWAG